YRSENYLGPPGFNQNQNRNNQNQNFQNQNINHEIPQGNNQGRNQFFQGVSHGQNPPSAYQAPAYQTPGYQAPVHHPPIHQPQVVTTDEFTNFMKANDAILKNMQTNMTSLKNSNLKLKNMFSHFMKMNTASSSGLGTLPGNIITIPKEELKGITTRSGTAYQGLTIPTTSSSLPKVVERETKVTKDIVPPTNNASTKDVQPLLVQTETPILNFEPVVAPIIEPVVSPWVSSMIALESMIIHFEVATIWVDQLGGSVWVDFKSGELTLRVAKEAITFNLDQTSRYSANYNDMTTIRINVIDMACEEYSQEDSDFLLEEVDAFLALEDDPTSLKVDKYYVDTEGDILLLEAFINDDPSLPPPNQGNYLPQIQKELKICEAKSAVLGQRQEKHFRPIHYGSKTMTEAESNNTTTEKEMLAVVYAFKKFWSYLIMNKSIVYKDYSTVKYLFAKKDSKARLLRWVLLLQEFTFKVIGTKGAENLAANHLSRLENPHQNMLDPKEINESFPLETLNMIWNPRAIISDRGTYFGNDQFANVMLKYGVTHRLSTPYYPQTSGQVEVSNRGLKRILERTVGENRASWLDKLDDALWAFRTAYKTPIGCTSYKLVYGKACHLSIELEHKAYWALKHANFNLQTTSDHHKFQLNELCDQAYKNSLIYKEKTKRLHDSKIKDHVFNIGDRVLLFNSRLKIFSGKLKTHWSRPFTITHVFPYGTVELSQTDGPNFKVNGHRLKHYFGEDIPKMVVPDLQTFPKDQ
nr:reverse transcriptase domain-containing protein [Tanacetum cinerariifolium]